MRGKAESRIFSQLIYFPHSDAKSMDGKIARSDRNRFDSRERDAWAVASVASVQLGRCGFDYALTTFFFSPRRKGDVIRTKGKRARTWQSPASARIAEKRYDGGQKFQSPPGSLSHTCLTRVRVTATTIRYQC